MAYTDFHINNNLLISLVKVRPALYDKNNKDYAKVDLKRKTWKEVAAEVCRSNWSSMTATDRHIRVTEVVKRWNNLRGAFARELRRMRNPLCKKRRKYMYFDKLMFVLGNNHEKDQEEDEDQLRNDSEENDDSKEDASTRKSIDGFEKSQIKSATFIMENSPKKQIREQSIIESVAKTDLETNFAMSLIAMLKMIPMNKKIDAHIEILNVIKKYKSDDEMVKVEAYNDCEYLEEIVEEDSLSQH